MIVAIALGLTLASQPALAPTGFAGFDDFLARLRDAPQAARGELTRRYVDWQSAHGGFPVIEKDSAVFVYVGTGHERTVRVIGDFKSRGFNSVLWDISGDPLASSGAVHYRRMRLERDARLLYRFVVDGKFVNDPLNARTFVTGCAPDAGKDGIAVSDLVMPDYRTKGMADRPSSSRAGRTLAVDEPWATPHVMIHLPPGYDPARRYPAVYVADGGIWDRVIGFPAVLDDLVAAGAIEPAIVVLIDPTDDRGGWYNFRSPYLPYLEQVVAWVDAHFSTRASPSARVHVGSSAGGRASLAVVLERPDLFANAALFSPALAASPHYYEPYFSGRRRPDRHLRIWLSAGTYEGSIHEDAHMLERYLRANGIGVETTYTHEGHSLAAWSNLAGDMLTFFFRRR